MTDTPVSQDSTPEALLAQLDALMQPSEPLLTQLANAAAFLYWSMAEVNWLGFYLAEGDVLYLGPFHGKPACTLIPIGSGVCGTAAADGQTQHVDDVHSFPGHIACDAASNSEVVVPLFDAEQRVWGVLDVDSPRHARFSNEDVRFLEHAAELVQHRCIAAGGRIFPLDKTS
ncbi:GAF domain-containing protein [bacterium]|nr:GAF domain-containing protein [bacterium]